MTEVEAVALWVSIISAVLSIGLAGVAMYFSLHVNARNQELTEKFANTLTTITEKTTRVESVVNNHTDRIVEAFIATRVGSEAVQLPTEVPETDGHTDSTEQPAHRALLDPITARLVRDVEELKLRQRLSGNVPSGRAWVIQFQPGDMVRVRVDAEEAEYRGRYGTVVIPSPRRESLPDGRAMEIAGYTVEFAGGERAIIPETELDPAPHR